jgi:hypothetical protein
MKALSTQQWISAGFLLFYAVILGLVKTVVLLIALMQFLSLLSTGGVNEQLVDLGKSLTVFTTQLVAFLTFNCRVRPFPFSAWPEPNDYRKLPVVRD